MARTASASCQRRGRNRRRSARSCTATVESAAAQPRSSGAPFAAAVPCGVTRDGSWRRIACCSRCSASLGSMPRSSTSVPPRLRRMRRAPPLAGRRGRARASAARGAVLATGAHARADSAPREPVRAGRARGRSRSDPSARPAAARRAAPPRLGRRDSNWIPASVGPRQSASASCSSCEAVSDSPSAMQSQACTTRLRSGSASSMSGVYDEPVAALRGHDRVVTVTRERLAQFRDVDIDGLSCGRRRRGAPQLVDQALSRDELIGMQEQHGQNDAAPSSVPSARGTPSSSTSSGPRIRNSIRVRFTASRVTIEAIAVAQRPRALPGLRSRLYARSERLAAWLARPTRRHATRSPTTVRSGPMRAATRPSSSRRSRAARAAARVRASRPRSAEQGSGHGGARDGRFTIATDQPHVKVAWRLTGQRSTG